MGAVESKTSDATQLQFCETQVIRLLEAQRQEYERKLQEEASEAATLKKLLKEAFITQNRLEKKIVATKKLLKETAVKNNLKEEASNRKILKEAVVKKLDEKSKVHSSGDDSSNSSRDYSISSAIINNRKSGHAKKDVSLQTRVPCPHTSRGCKLNLKLADMEIHLKECPFMEHDCPVGAAFGKCKWQGELSEVSRHFDEIHPNSLVPEMGSEFRLRYIHGNHRYVRLIGKDGYFVFHAKISQTDEKMYMTVQLIGTKEIAMKCEYQIHLDNKRESGREYKYSDNCCSIRDNIEEIFQKNECVVLPMTFAKTFIYNGALYMKIFIDYSP